MYMNQLDQIIKADCIGYLNYGPEQWIDLVFADPPFNYHGYEDERKQEDYLKFSEEWMRAVHRALKPDGSFYLAIGDEYAADRQSKIKTATDAFGRSRVPRRRRQASQLAAGT
jgi:DNA modification methylase